MSFIIANTNIEHAVKWEKILKIAVALRFIFLALSAVFLVFVIIFERSEFLGLLLISFLFSLFFKTLESFKEEKLKRRTAPADLEQAVQSPEKFNLADFLDFEAGRVLLKNPGNILLAILENCPESHFVFNRLCLSPKEIIKGLKESSQKNKEKDNIPEIVLSALKIALQRKKQLAGIGDILIALSYSDLFLKSIMNEAGILKKDIENLVLWLEDLQQERPKYWEYESLARRGTLAKTWAAGYAPTLERFGIDLTEKVRGLDFNFIAHIDEEHVLERALSKQGKKNALLVGNPGSGRKSMIYCLAQRALLGKSFPEVNYKRVIELSVHSVLTHFQSQEQVEFVLDKIFKEALFAGNIILVITDFHNYIGETEKLAAVDISGVLAPYLETARFQIVGITDYEGLHSNIEKNFSFLQFFEKVEVSEVSSVQALKILQTLVPGAEKKHKIFISYQALKDIVEFSDRFLPNLFFPEKAIEIFDETLLCALNSKEKIVLPKHAAKVITERTEIPVGEVEAKEKEILINLEELIHQRIINQEEAVQEVSTALRRARSEITIRKGPLGCFLFLGPTGVGKTETAKALAEIYFGSEEKIIRLDMSEFQNLEDIARLIGSEKADGLLTSPVRENPFSLVLLDEIEKAHLNILNLFLQVLDEGHLTDGMARKVDFKNTLIIATSNAGYEIILSEIENIEWEKVKEKLLDYFFKNNVFRPELINRFDAVVVFSPLSKENLLSIADLMLRNLKENLEKKGIDFVSGQGLKEKIVEIGYNPKFGAREMRRVIQDKVENPLAHSLLSGKIKKGSKVEIDSEFRIR